MVAGEEWINITEASRRYRRSRYVIAQLIKRGGIETRQSGRSRLMRVSDIEGALTNASLPPRSKAQEVMDNALGVVYSAQHHLVSSLFPGDQRSVSIEELRKSRLGNDLTIFLELAYGERKEPRDQVNERLDSVLQLLFWAPMAEDYQVPREFWETDLGRMLSIAKYRAYERSELLTVGEAATLLRVTRPTLYRWLDEKHLDYVRDDLSGQTFVVREDVDALLEWAGAADGDDDRPQQDRGPPCAVNRKAVDAPTPTASLATTPTIPSRSRCVDANGLNACILPHAAGPLIQ